MATVELQFLAWSVILGLVHLMVTASFVNRQRGMKWAGGARDEVRLPPTAGPLGRLWRSFENFKETFPFFVAAVALVHFNETTGHLSETGVQLYFWSRLAYIPLYIMGWPLIRSAAWFLACIGIAMITYAAF